MTVSVGDSSPVLEWKGEYELWNRYAAVNDEFVPIHMDDEAGRAAGLPGAIGMGNLNVAMLHRLLREWFGELVRVESLAVQFRGPAVRGQINRARGVVTAVEQRPEGLSAQLEVWVEDEAGTRLTPGTATVVVSN